MPSYFYEIPDVGSTVEKTVTDNVTKNVLANMGIENADIVYEGQEYAEQSQPDSTVGEKRKQSYGSSDRIVVSVEEQRDPLSRIERAPGYYLDEPFFHDKNHGVKLIPSMVKYDVTITVKRRAPSKATIQNWCNEIQRKTDMGRDMFPTHADFYYKIPVPALNLLKSCYETQYWDMQPPYPLQGYFKKFFTNNVTVVSTLAGKNLEYAVRVSEQRILGIFDTEGPKERKGDKFTAWECEFTFKFNYHRPEAVEAIFPIMLNNTLIEREWWMDNLAPGLMDLKDAGAGVFVEAAEHIVEPPYIKLPVYIPQCDKPNLPIPSGNVGDVPIGVIHLEMTPSDTKPNYLFNLGQLGDEIQLSDTLLDYIKQSYSEDVNGGDSVVKVYVFENNYVVKQDRVAIDASLDVYLNNVVQVQNIYRVVIVIELEWSTVTDAGFDYLRRYPELVESVSNEFRPEVVNKYPIDKTRDRIPPAQLDNIIKEMGGYDELAHGNYGIKAKMRDMITVHNNSIISYRRKL